MHAMKDGHVLKDEDCPVSSGHPHGRAMDAALRPSAGRGGRELSVDAHAVPVVGSDGITHGLTLLLHDVRPKFRSSSAAATCMSWPRRIR